MSTPTSVPREQLREALERHASRIALIPEGPTLAWVQKVAAELPDTLEGIYGDLLDDLDRSVNYALMLGLGEVVPRAQPLVLTGDLELSRSSGRVKVYTGDVHVKGDFTFDCDVVVFGNLTVEGVLEDGDEFMALLVRGSLQAAAIGCGHKLWSGGRISADVIALTRRGSLYAEQDIGAQLFVANTSESRVLSPVQAATMVDGKQMDADPEAAMKVLRSVLHPSCFAESEPDYFEPAPLLDRVREKKPWAKSR